MTEPDDKNKVMRRKKMIDLLNTIERHQQTAQRLQSILKCGKKNPTPKSRSVRFPSDDQTLAKVTYFDNSQDPACSSE